MLSKGHAAPLLYTLFAMAGAYPLEELQTLRKYGSRFEGHPVPKFVYAEAATGSLGQGISVAAGLALIAKRENLPAKSLYLPAMANWQKARYGKPQILQAITGSIISL